MNENLIFEGNTIYEIDPVCMREKQMYKEREKRGIATGYYSCQSVRQPQNFLKKQIFWLVLAVAFWGKCK